MRCLVEIPDRVEWRAPRGRRARGSQGLMNKVVMYRSIETTVYRVALPKIQNADSPYVLVDAWVPDDRRNAIPVLSEDWIAPGVYRARALVSRNRKTLAPFLASGLNEMDVTEVEL